MGDLDPIECARGHSQCLSSVESSAGGILVFTWFTLVTYSAQRHHSLGRVHFKAIPFTRLSSSSVTCLPSRMACASAMKYRQLFTADANEMRGGSRRHYHHDQGVNGPLSHHDSLRQYFQSCSGKY